MSLSVDGRVFAWGDPYKGKLGNLDKWTHETQDTVSVPSEIRLHNQARVVKVVCGGIHSALLDENG